MSECECVYMCVCECVCVCVCIHLGIQLAARMTVWLYKGFYTLRHK